MTNEARLSRSTVHRRPRRGVALLLVLGVVAVASIISWAMLSSASLRARVDANVKDSVESKYLADSGVSYAMYYLRYPEKSPVALTTGAYNNFYAGQTGVRMWTDAGGLVDITVTNTALNTFLIRSTAIVQGTTQTVESEVTLTTVGYKVETAAAFGGAITLPSQVTITGPVSTVSNILDSVGNLLTSLGGATVSVSSSAVPAFSDLLQVTETGVTASTGGTDRTYSIDGVKYVAEKAPATITGTLLTTRPALNPANVWYSETDVVLNGATINGTLILRTSGTGVQLQGTSTINVANNGLPALIVPKDLTMKHATLKPAKLTVQGVTWIGSKVTVTGTSISAGALNFVGSLLMGGATPKIEGTTGPVAITKTAGVANTTLTQAKTITGITVNRWTRL